MRISYRALAAFCTLALSVNTGCSGNNISSGSAADPDSLPLSVEGSADAEVSNPADSVSEKDMSPSTDSASSVVFSSNGAECLGRGISAEGSVVTITQAGSYSVSGSCENGRLVIDCGKKDDVFLVLDGLSLTCSDGPAIICENADKLTITLNGSSVNTLSDGTGYTAEAGADTGAALFSRDTLIINGTGSLVVNGVYKDGIKSKDGLKLCGGNITVNSAEDGIIGKDYVLAAAGTVSVNSGLDGLKSTNSTEAEKGYIYISGGSLDITSGTDAIQAETNLIITDGSIKITSGGGSAAVQHTADSMGGGFYRGARGDFFTDGTNGFDFSDMTSSDGTSAESMKGIKAGVSVTVSGGEITADCADDAVHSNGKVTIDGGRLTLSTGDDGIHAESLITIKNGEISITDSFEGIESPGIEITDGAVNVISFDDGLNAGSDSEGSGASPYITISGGCITVNAEGDGIDSNGTISMSGGTLVIFGPTNGGNGAIDYQQSFAMSGGTLIALGSRGMAQAPSTLLQPCISIYSSAAADSTIEIRDEEDNVIISTITPKQCDSLIFSSPDFASGSVYSIYANDSLLSAVTATDGVSGGGASGSGGGGWNQDGGMNPGGFGRPGDSGEFPSDRQNDFSPDFPFAA